MNRRTSNRSSLSITLKPGQTQVSQSDARFKVLIAGRRFGKTYTAIASLLMAAAAPGSLCWYVAPTYRQAKQIAWRKLKELVPVGVRTSTNESELSMRLRNGSFIELRGANNADSLRGVGLDHLVLDEFAQIPEWAWDEVLRPALADKEGTALFIGTPQGFSNWAYKVWQNCETSDLWQRWKFTSLEGGNIKPAEIEEARRSLDPVTFRQEFEASFEAKAGRVYYGFDRTLNACDDVVIAGEAIHIGMDFNIGKMAAIAHVMRNGEPRAVDEFVDLLDTPTMIDAIKARYQGHGINVYPDASGKNRDTANANTSDLALLRAAGFRVIVNPANPGVRDRVNAMNAAFCNANGDRRYRVNVMRCPLYVQCLEQQIWKDGAPDKTSGLDHRGDGGGYFIVKIMPAGRADPLARSKALATAK